MQFIDWANMCCSACTLIATIAIGSFQYMQNSRINKLTSKQVKKEQQQYRESVEIQTRQFLSKYHECIGLLPLCAIAFAYDENREYHRQMYSDFRLLSKDVRNEIFKRCGWVMCNVQTGDFYEDCLKCLETAISEFLPNDEFSDMFYDNGKYIERAIKEYAKENCPDIDSNKLSNIVVEFFRDDSNKGHAESVIENVKEEFSFKNCEEIDACNIACLTAKYIAICSKNKYEQKDTEMQEFGSPGGWHGERIETMEDLFLLTLFEIWSNIWCLKDKKVVQ